MRNTSLRRTAKSLAHYLIPKSQLRSQDFWDKHLPLIEHIGTIGAILSEHRYFFPKTWRRKIAWELIVATDLAWQTIRTLSGKSGSDQDWLARELPEDHDVLFPAGTPHSFAPVVNLVEDITWVFGLHTNLRHPGSNCAYLYLMLSDPWPEAEGTRLSCAAEGTEAILNLFKFSLEPGNGFASDIDEKQELMRQANKNRMRWQR